MNHDSNFCPLLKIGYCLDVDGDVRNCHLSKLPLTHEPQTTDWVQQNCSSCIYLEQQSLRSVRSHMLERFSNSEKTQDELYIDLRPSNKCNLACATCSSKYSSYWENLESSPIKTKSPPELTQQLISLLSSTNKTTHVVLAGGEPLLNVSLLRQLISAVSTNLNAKKHFHLHIVTNLSVLPTELLELIPLFHKTLLGISLDSFGQENQYLRFPLEESLLQKNLLRLINATTSDLYLQPTISVLNIFSIHTLVDFTYKIKQLTGRSLPIFPHLLINPKEINLFFAPISLRPRFLLAIEKTLNLLPADSFLQELKNEFESLKKMLLRPEDEFVSREDILLFLESIDRLRKTQFQDSLKELFGELQKC